MADSRDAMTQAVDSMWAALETVKFHLVKPYPDDPRWTPWSRFVEPAVTKLIEADRARTAGKANG